MKANQKTFTKAEFVRACGEFFEAAADLWQRRVEQWTEDGVLRPIDNPHSASGRPRRYSEEEVYIALVLFRLKAIGFSLPTIRAVSRFLRTPWDIDLDKMRSSDPTQEGAYESVRRSVMHTRDYWNACKDDTWDEERWGGPPSLTILLVPDSGLGFAPGELEVMVYLGPHPAIIPGCESIRFDPQAIFSAARVRPAKRMIISTLGPESVFGPGGVREQPIMVAG
jgi:DNA-binding transcriptional MerR regulator